MVAIVGEPDISDPCFLSIRGLDTARLNERGRQLVEGIPQQALVGASLSAEASTSGSRGKQEKKLL